MCNLLRVRASAADVAAAFGMTLPPMIDVPHETVRATRGLVVRERAGRRLLQSLDWGFPHLNRDMIENGEKPSRVNLVADLTNPMWSEMVQDPRYRCLIPVTDFAEPDGAAGCKTRTWFRVADQQIFAWAGFCRNTEAFGPVFAGMTTNSNAVVAPFSPRMPVLLRPNDYERWLHGTISDVIGFQYRKYLPERLIFDRTGELWRGGTMRQPAPALL